MMPIIQDLICEFNNGRVSGSWLNECSFKALARHYDPEGRQKFYSMPKHSHKPMMIGISGNRRPDALKNFEPIVFQRDVISVLER
jgi:hypothetical protein